MKRIVVLASGSGSNFQAVVDRCNDGSLAAEVVALVTDKEGVYSVSRAKTAGIPSFTVLKSSIENRAQFDRRLLAAIQYNQPDLVVLAGFMRILGEEFVSKIGVPCINIHPSLLPRHKGAHGVRDTFDSGDSEAGCTTHFVTATLDGGPHILQAKLPVLPSRNAEELAARVLALEHVILPRTIDLVLRGEAVENLHGTRLAPSTSWLPKITVKPDWLLPAEY